MNALAISPDGLTGASAGDDWAVKIWDLSTRQVRSSLHAHTGPVHGLAFSPDGKLLASGSQDGTIALWDVDKGRVVRALLGHSRSHSSIRFSPDGKTLVAGGENGIVKLWDVENGQEQSPLTGHSGAVRCVAFSPDGARMASGGADRTVCLYDLARRTSRKFTAPAGVNDVAFSSDGRTLGAVGDAPDSAVRLWDLVTGVESTWLGQAGPARGLAFSPTEPLLATCGEDNTVRLWNRTGSDVGPRTIDLGPAPLGLRAIAFTSDGRHVATANGNGTVYFLNVRAIPNEPGRAKMAE